MIIKRVAFVLAAMMAVSHTLSALPQVAVVKASLSKDFDKSYEPLLTSRIEEALLKSGKFQVLDRADIDKVLKEKEFQLSSGLVSDDELVTIGNFLGADFVITVSGSRIGQTFALSAKMIDVATGEIVGQANEEGKGKVDVILDLARKTGNTLASTNWGVAKREEAKQSGLQISEKGQGEERDLKNNAVTGDMTEYRNSISLVVNVLPGPVFAGGVCLGGAYRYKLNASLGVSIMSFASVFSNDENLDRMFSIIAGPSIAITDKTELVLRAGYLGGALKSNSTFHRFSLNPSIQFLKNSFIWGIDINVAFGRELHLGSSLYNAPLPVVGLSAGIRF